jgi:hypothetical protein
MKSVCKYCAGKALIRWGSRRRYCEVCNRTFRVKLAGRKPVKHRDMYLLDRSTYRRIGKKKKTSHVSMISKVQQEVSILSTPTDYLKKI